ncbi:unnamed protein product [Orchesella dallaii]|uniref:Uncharacterized protein n=1 Tax=Orchesella dallaii TaxID=48710 RepID=A0ABP1PW74_9HEXA
MEVVDADDIPGSGGAATAVGLAEEGPGTATVMLELVVESVLTVAVDRVPTGAGTITLPANYGTAIGSVGVNEREESETSMPTSVASEK